MEWFTRSSTAQDAAQIVADLLRDLTPGYDLALIFFSGLSREIQQEVKTALTAQLHIRQLAGCSCAGIITDGQEMEERPACSLILARLPGVRVNPFYLNQEKLDALDRTADWYEVVDAYPNENPYFIILPDPFLIDVNQFLVGLEKVFPRRPVLGGLASGAAYSKGNSLWLGENVYAEGMIGLTLTGDVRMDTVVSQGCRPIGANYIVTKADQNIIYEVAGRPFYEVIVEEISKVSARERALARESLFVGIAMDEYKHKMGRGDFLIRLILGVDEKSGAGVVADQVKVGQTIQLQVRDSLSADEDLNLLLKGYCDSHPQARPLGALIFSCNGRGKNLFKAESHDTRAIQRFLGPVPASGFFCSGEIGPVGGRNFIHGFTVSLGLFYPAAA